MATKHGKRSRTVKRFATMGAATVTAAVLTAGLVAPTTTAQPVNPLMKSQRAEAVDLSASVSDLLPLYLAHVRANLASLGIGTPDPNTYYTTDNAFGTKPLELAPGAPDPAAIPDLTFGLGTQAYNGFQTVGAELETFILDNFNLAFVLEAFGLDPETAINNALGGLLVSVLAGIPVDLAGVVGGIPVVGALLAPVLTAAGIDNVGAILALLGFNLSNPLNLPGLPNSGLNIITTGPLFTLLKFIGVDIGWVPGFPNSVAEEINNTDYLDVGVAGLLSYLSSQIPTNILNPARIAFNVLAGALTTLGLQNADLADIRVPIVIGTGLGAFAAGAAYEQVAADLQNQVGGANGTPTGLENALLGSYTILPMILLFNPGRANGGLFARFYPLAALAGIDTVTPDTQVTSSSNPDNLLDVSLLGLNIGGANLIPIKVDATVEYNPLSDFPAWPNPFSLANAAAAGLFPTYILRGLNLTDATTALLAQALPQLTEGLASDPLAFNLYLTLPTDALPLLEPVRLPLDFINLISPVKFNNQLADAFEPALKILVNLGYTDVDQADGYNRTLDMGDVLTPFGTLPSNVDWSQVPGDVFDALVAGITAAIAEGPINNQPGGPDSALATVTDLLGISNNGTLDLAAVADLVSGLLGGLNPGGLTTLSQSLSGAGTPNALGSLNDIVSQATGGLGLPSAAGNTQLAQAKTSQAEVPDVSKVPAILDSLESPLSGATLSLKERAETLKLSGAEAEANLRKAGKQLSDAADNARDQADKSFKKATKRLNDIAEKGRKDIERAVKDVDTQAKKSVANVKAAQKKAQAKPAS